MRDGLNGNKVIVKKVIDEIEKLCEENFCKLWNVYCNNSIGIKASHDEGLHILKKVDLRNMNGFTYDEAMFSMAEDVCIYYTKTYKGKTYTDKDNNEYSLLPTSISDIVKDYHQVDVESLINAFASAF